MPGKRITDLTALSGANSANNDDLVIFDATASETKRISRSQLAEGMQADVQVFSNKTIALTGNTVNYNQGGTGASTRTVQARLQDYVSVKDFGAVGDGVTNDTAAIQAAMSASKNLYFPDGTYNVPTWTTQSITTARTKLWGSGVIQGNGSTAFIKPLVSFEIDGLTIKGFTSAIQNSTSDSGTIDQLFISNCTFRDNNGHIGVELPVNNARIVNNFFKNTLNGYAIRIGENDYSLQDTWQNLVIDGNNFNNVDASGANNASAILVYGRNAVISNNTIEDVESTGTGEAWAIYTKCRFSSVVGNSIRNVIAPSSVYAINIKGNERTDTSAPQGYTCAVVGNTVYSSQTARGVGIRAANDEITITGNSVEGWSEGIGAESGTSDGTTVTGNAIYGFGSYGINLVQNGSNLMAVGNTIRGLTNASGVGIRAATSVAVSNWVINSNAIKTVGTGVSLNNNATVTNVQITANALDDTGVRPISIEECNQIKISGNTFSNTTTTQLVWFSGVNENVDISENGLFYVQTTSGSSVNAQVLNTSVEQNDAYLIEVMCVGRQDDGTDHGGYKIAGLFKAEGGTVTQVGTTQSIYAIESDATWAGPNFNIGSDDIQIRLSGAASNTIDWSVSTNIKSVGVA